MNTLEWSVVFETLLSACVGVLQQWLQQVYPYAVPQILMRTAQVNPDYVHWVAALVKP